MPSGFYQRSKEYREIMSQAMKGNTHTLGKRWKVADTNNYKKAAQKRVLDKDYCQKISDTNKRRWKVDTHYRNKMIGLLIGNKYTLGKTWKVADSSKMGKANRIGSKNGRWCGGKSFEPYPLGWTKTFKEQIRYRDEYKCQMCGKPEVENNRKLDVHHIDYNKKNLALNNLISLCKSCHNKTISKRLFWIEYFKQDKQILINKINSIEL